MEHLQTQKFEINQNKKKKNLLKQSLLSEEQPELNHLNLKQV